MRIFWKNTVKIVSSSGALPPNPRLPPAARLPRRYSHLLLQLSRVRFCTIKCVHHPKKK